MLSTCYKTVNRLWPLSYFSVKLWVTLQEQTSKSKTSLPAVSLTDIGSPGPRVCVKGVRGVFAVSVAVWFVHFGAPRHGFCQSILVLLASEWRTVPGGISGPGQRKPEPSPCPASSLAPRPAWTQAKASEKWHWALWAKTKGSWFSLGTSWTSVVSGPAASTTNMETAAADSLLNARCGPRDFIYIDLLIEWFNSLKNIMRLVILSSRFYRCWNWEVK